MKKILNGLILTFLLVSPVISSGAQVSVGISTPNISIGINLPMYPELAPVPGYPVYYAPQVDANYFFYDGMYWTYYDDNWYASSWYNGPWAYVQPEVVPLFILRVPVRYYRQPPVYFRGWHSHAPPRWGQHWGRDWERRRSGWNKWQRSSVPKRAPLPVYQRQYTGERYPARIEQQQELRTRQYRYQPRSQVVRQHYKQKADKNLRAPAQREGRETAPLKNQRQPQYPSSAPQYKDSRIDPRQQPAQRGDVQNQRPGPYQPQPLPQQRPPASREQFQQQRPAYYEQQTPRGQGQVKQPLGGGEQREHNGNQGQGQKKEDGRGHQ